MDELIDSPNRNDFKTNKGNKYLASFFILLIVVTISFCFDIFSSEPSLGYLILLFIAAIIIVLGIIVIILLIGSIRILAAIIIFASATAIFFAAINNGQNEEVMNTGKIVVSICFLANVFLLVKVLIRKRKAKK